LPNGAISSVARNQTVKQVLDIYAESPNTHVFLA